MLAQALTHSLGLSPSYIDKLATTASHRYKHFRVPKANGGTRDIYHPAKELKAIQRWLLYNILQRFPIHEAAAAYRRGRNLVSHARQHVHSRYLLRLDLEDFFWSIDQDDIVRYVTSQSAVLPKDWTSTDTEMLAALVCRDGGLTIGAATSPALSNAVCFGLDRALSTKCAEVEVTYTRYADDMFFSTQHANVLETLPKVVEDVLRALPYPKQLRLNNTKTRHTSLKRHRRVTGLVLTSQGGISIGRSKKRSIRSAVHNSEHLGPESRRRLAGLLAYIKDVEPSFFNKLVLKYGTKALDAARFDKVVK